MAKNRYTRTTIYVDAAKLKRQAAAWARTVREKTGAEVSQPVSAFVRFLVEQLAKSAGRKR